MVNIVKNFLTKLSNLKHMFLKLLQKEEFKKQRDATGDLIGNKRINLKSLNTSNAELLKTITNDI